MKKSILIIFCMFLLLASFASALGAECSTDAADYYHYDDTGLNIDNDYNFDFDNGAVATDEPFTIELINVRWDSAWSGDDNPRWGVKRTDESATFASVLDYGSGWYIYDGGSRSLLRAASSETDYDETIYFYPSTNKFDIYIDGVLESANATVSWIDIGAVAVDSLRFDVASEDMEIDEIYVYAGKDCPVSAPAVTNWTLSVQDVNNDTITGYNLTIYYNGTTHNYQDDAGTVTTGIYQEDGEIVNITFNKVDWLEMEYNLINASEPFYFGGVHQSKITTGGREIITNSSILGGTSYINNNAGYLGNNHNVTAGTHNVTYEVANYYNKTVEITVSALEENNYTYWVEGIYQAVLNTSLAFANGTAITEYDLNVTGINETYNLDYSATEQYTPLYLLFGDYNVTLDSDESALNNQEVNVYSAYQAHAITVYQQNSINFSFYNEETGEPIVSEVTAELIGSSYSYNYSTSQGSFWATLIFPDAYTIRYNADGYDERLYYFTLVDDTVNWLDLYLLNETQATNVKINVFDEVSYELEGAQVRSYRYDLSSNSYILQEMCETGSDGSCYLNLQLASEFYKFNIYYNGDLKKETSGAYVPAGTSELNFFVDLTGTVAENYFKAQDVTYSLTFDQGNNMYRYMFSDANAIVSQGCLYVYDMSNGGKDLINASCVSAASGIIYVTVANTTDAVYKGDAYVYYDDTPVYLASLYADYPGGVDWGDMGLYLVVVLMIIFAIMGAWSPTLAAILTPVPLVIARAASIIQLNWGVIIATQIIGLAIAALLAKHG
jgi:hypothetical protein